MMAPRASEQLDVATTHCTTAKQEIRTERAQKGGGNAVKCVLKAKGEPVHKRGNHDRWKGQPVRDLASSPVTERGCCRGRREPGPWRWLRRHSWQCLLLHDVRDVAVSCLDLADQGLAKLLPSGNSYDCDQPEDDDVFDGGKTTLIMHEGYCCFLHRCS